MNFFEIKIIPVDDESRGDEVVIEYNEEMFNDFIRHRKLILNDIIYPDKVKYAHTQQNYNTAWKKIISRLNKSGKIKLKDCEIILLKGTKELKQQLTTLEQQRKADQLKFEQQLAASEEKRILSDEKIESLINRIQQLENK